VKSDNGIDQVITAAVFDYSEEPCRKAESNTKVSDGALNFRAAQEKLNSAQVIDQHWGTVGSLPLFRAG
jgi:hypothetical protein